MTKPSTGFHKTYRQGVFIANLWPQATMERIATNAGYARNFSAGQSIGSTVPNRVAAMRMLHQQTRWVRGTVSSTNVKGLFAGSDGYLGVRLKTGSGIDPKYGWIHYHGAILGDKGTNLGWAWQDSGGTIHAGEAQ